MEDIAQRLLNGDQRALSRSISLLEQGSPEAVEVMKAIDSHTGRCYTVGITGPPGAGKSTVVDRPQQQKKHNQIRLIYETPH